MTSAAWRCPAAEASKVVEAEVGASVRLEAPDGARVAEWVELSAPVAVMRGGRRGGGPFAFRPRLPGVYRFAALHVAGASLAKAEVFEVRVGTERERSPRAAIHGPRLVGSGESVRYSVEVEWPDNAAAGETRWRQLSGPDLGIGRGEREAALELRPRFAGRYRLGASARTERGWTREATFAFEVPFATDGRAATLPVARVRPPASPRIEEEAVLDASGSSSGSGRRIAHRWVQLGGPPAELLGEGERVSFFPFYGGRYEFSLIVEDESGLVSRPEHVTVEVPERAGESDPEEEPEDALGPLDRRVSLQVRDGTVATLTGLLGREGVYVRTAPDLGDPVAISRMPVDLWAVDLPVGKVLDWLGRQLGASYVLEPNGGVWFTRQTEWLASLPRTMRSYRVDALHARDDAGEIVGMMREAVRAVLWLGQGADVGSADKKLGAAAAILPECAHERLGALISELRAPVPSGFGPAVRDSRALETSVTADYRGWVFRDIVWDLARQARVSIGWNPSALDRERRFDLALGETTLGEALARLSEEAGLAGPMAESSVAIWLHQGARPPMSARSLWQSAVVRSYDTRLLAQRHGISGPMLTHLIRSRVRPERWSGPFVFTGHSAARRRLVVIHDEEMQREVAAFLALLAVEGEGALDD